MIFVTADAVVRRVTRQVAGKKDRVFVIAGIDNRKESIDNIIVAVDWKKVSRYSRNVTEGKKMESLVLTWFFIKWLDWFDNKQVYCREKVHQAVVRLRFLHNIVWSMP